ncbi:hypothetical protein E4U54_000188 [Claviceps lovelessii]|nr:hypothetical protein E4U54_000188 [Claviceps lovelessii]
MKQPRPSWLQWTALLALCFPSSSHRAVVSRQGRSLDLTSLQLPKVSKSPPPRRCSSSRFRGLLQTL